MSQPPAPLTHTPADSLTLASHALIAPLAPQDSATLLALLEPLSVPAGTEVIRQGEVGEHMYFILEGEAVARRGRLHLQRLLAGDSFGELGLLGLLRRRTVEAVTELRLARLSRARWQNLANDDPELALVLLKSIAQTMGEELVTITDSVGYLLKQRSLPRRTQLQIRIDDSVRTIATGAQLRELLPQAIDGCKVVAALLDSKPVSLHTPLLSDATIAPLSLSNWEGREVYRRSVGLLLLEAAHRIAPELRVRLSASIGIARAVSVEMNSEAPSDFAERLAQEMRRLIAKDITFREEVWALEEARMQLSEQGFRDASSLLSTFREPTVTLMSCGSLYTLSTGPVLPTTGMIQDFALLPHPEGLLLDFGEAIRAHVPKACMGAPDPLEAEQKLPRFGGDMANAQRRWLRAQEVTSVGALTQRCISGKVSELIRVSEGFHEKRIGQIADVIANKNGQIRAIGIAGPSSSGKTTFIKRLSVHLEIEGVHPVNISLDDYYLDRERIIPNEEGEYDFESLSAFDLPLLRDHLERLSRGEVVKTARFDFLKGKSFPQGGPELRLGERDVLLIEGIHGLNPAIFSGILPRSQAYLVFIHPATTLRLDPLSMMTSADLRLLRRIVRDRHQRNYTAADNIQRWGSVRRGEALHIYPLLPHADVVFDSSLIYEPSVLKVYAERYLLEVPPHDPAFATAYRLRHLIDRFVAIYPDHVPPTSIAREFIGGSGFEY